MVEDLQTDYFGSVEGACEMTIEQDAVSDIEIVLSNLEESGLTGYCAVISKALKAKQDRIEELENINLNIRENLCLNLDEDLEKLQKLTTENLVCKAITGIFWRDKRINELEGALREIIPHVNYEDDD